MPVFEARRQIPPRLYWAARSTQAAVLEGFRTRLRGRSAGPVGEVWALGDRIPLDGGSVPLGDGHGLLLVTARPP